MPHDIPSAIARAAEVRAHGGSWPAAAQAAGWTAAGIQRWIRGHRQLWACEVGRARRDSRDEACDESVVALRKKLRAKTDKTVLEAAKIIGSGRGAASESLCQKTNWQAVPGRREVARETLLFTDYSRLCVDARLHRLLGHDSCGQ